VKCDGGPDEHNVADHICSKCNLP